MSEIFPEKPIVPQDEQLRAYIESGDWTRAERREEELVRLRETAEE